MPASDFPDIGLVDISLVDSHLGRQPPIPEAPIWRQGDQNPPKVAEVVSDCIPNVEPDVEVDLDRAFSALATAPALRVKGRVTEVTGLVLRATVPGVSIGELLRVSRTGAAMGDTTATTAAVAEGEGDLLAEVVGFRGQDVVAMPLGELSGVGPDSEVTPTGEVFPLRVGEGLLGRVLDGLGNPMDGLGPVVGPTQPWPVFREAPGAMERKRIDHKLAFGIRAIDGLLTVGEGQRVGLFAGSGVGKSTLLGQIARNTEADINVICLVGERGREVAEFITDSLGPDGLARSVVICATSDAPALVRLKSTFVATAIAEWFRDRGQKVLLMMDSVTRFARAQREVGLAAGEPPPVRGTRPASLPCCPGCWNGRGTTPQDPSRRCIQYWSLGRTWKSPSPMKCAASWTATLYYPGIWVRETIGPPLMCCRPFLVS